MKSGPRLARGVAAVGAALFAMVLTLSILNGSFQRDPLFLPLDVAIVAGYLGIGALLASQNPTNPIGWLLMTFAIAFEVGGGANEYAIYGLITRPGSLPLIAVGVSISKWAFIGMGTLPAVLLLFPTGSVPSRRWRPVLIGIGVSVAVLVVCSAIAPGPIDVRDGVTRPNPLGVASLDSVIRALTTIAAWALAILTLLSVLALVMRFRRADAEERQQIRWLASAAVLAVVFLVGAVISGIGVQEHTLRYTVNEACFVGFFVAAGLGIPLACAVAVLRYRLWDLDLVVKKTAIYSIVAVGLLALYLGLLAVAALAGASSIPVILVFVLTYSPVQRRIRRLAERIVYGSRATPYEVLSEFSERVGETYSVDDVLPRMTELLKASTGAKSVRAWIRTGAMMRQAAVAPADADRADDVAVDADGSSAFDDDVTSFPVSHQGELLGAITLRMHANDPMDPEKERLAQGVASQAGLALRNVRLVDELRSSRRRIVTAQDARAKQLERNIHDGVQQQLVALAVQLKLLQDQIGRDPDTATVTAGALRASATAALEDLRDLARGIYPPLLADQGLTAALEAQVRKAGVPASVNSDGIGRYGPDAEAAVYFCCLEALNNIAKYAGASRINVDLEETDAWLAFEVRDDGGGFDVGAPNAGTGLRGMADRIEAIGGVLHITSEPGRGTTVAGTVPVS